MLVIKTFAVILFSVFPFHVEAQDDPSSESPPPGTVHASLAVIIGILSTVFSITFLLLVYAKLCHSALLRGAEEVLEEEGHQGVLRSVSGIERSVIESLPFFTFSSLKGSKKGLECAVCLSKFEDIEVLRLLPQCRHAFHINCIDKWLESHSSCPLCRCKLDVGDLKNLSFTNSLRYSRNPSNLSEGPNLELLVQREQEQQRRSFRFNIVGSSLQKFGIGRKGENLISKGGKDDCSGRNVLHKVKHRIIVSDLIYKGRWSDVNSSDLMFLNSEMLNVKSSRRFSPFKSSGRRLNDEVVVNEDILKIKEDLERKRLYDSKVNKLGGISISASTSPCASNIGLNQSATSKLLVDSAGKRSMSEIVHVSRFAEFSGRNRTNESTMLSRSGRKDEVMRKLWMPIATRTVQWFAGRERGLEWKRSPWNV